MTTDETVSHAATILFGPDEFTPEQIAGHLETIESLSLSEMSRLWKLADSAHLYFDDRFPTLGEAFVRRFAKLGGFRAGGRNNPARFTTQTTEEV